MDGSDQAGPRQQIGTYGILPEFGYTSEMVMGQTRNGSCYQKKDETTGEALKGAEFTVYRDARWPRLHIQRQHGTISIKRIYGTESLKKNGYRESCSSK